MAYYYTGRYEGPQEDCRPYSNDFSDYGDYDDEIDYQPVDEASSIVEELINDNELVMFSFSYCQPCKKTEALLDKKGVSYVAYNVDTDPYISKENYIEALEALSGIRTVPQVFVRGEFLGGSEEVKIGLDTGKIQHSVGKGHDAKSKIHKLLRENEVVLFAFTYCGPCKRTKTLLDLEGIQYLMYHLDTDPHISQREYVNALEPLSGIRTVPQLFIRGKFYGDSQKVRKGVKDGEVQLRCLAHPAHSASTKVYNLLQDNDVIVFATRTCNYSKGAKRLLDEHNIPYTIHYIDTDSETSKEQYQDALEPLSGIRTVPQLFIQGRFYGDSRQTRRGIESGEVQYLCSAFSP